jgi:hypothetical protein
MRLLTLLFVDQITLKVVFKQVLMGRVMKSGQVVGLLKEQ